MRKRWIWVAVVIVVLVGGFFGYRAYAASRSSTASTALQTVRARIGTLTAQVGATGSVRANQSATLGFGTTGTVGTVNVQPGQKVKKGDVLATLDQSSLSPQVISAQADLISAQNALNELLQSGTAKAQAQLNLANAQKALQDAQYNLAVNQQGSRASSIVIQGAQANLTLAQEEVDHWQSVYDTAKSDGARAIAMSNLAAAQQQLQSIQNRLAWYTGAPSPVDQAILEADVAQAQAALGDAQRAYDQVKNGPNPADVASAQAKVAAAQATVDESKITAPFDGTATDVNIHPGDQAAPGTDAIDVADLSTYLVDVQVSEVDIDKVKVGQPATLTFDAILNKTYQGKVTEVSMTGTVVSGVVDFIVTVQVTDPDASIRPGMTAAVNITVSSVSGALLVPSRAVRTFNNQQVVFVLRNGKSTPVPVKLGASSDTFSQVVSGDLKEGDEVLVNPTTTGTGAARAGGGGFIIGGGGFGGGGFRGGN